MPASRPHEPNPLRVIASRFLGVLAWFATTLPLVIAQYWLLAASVTLIAAGVALLPFGIQIARQKDVTLSTTAATEGVAKPKLSASFTEMVQLIEVAKNEKFLGVMPALNEPSTMLFVQVVVKNDGSPSTADNWSMWLTVDGNDVRAEILPVPDFKYRMAPTQPAVEFSQREAIYNVGVAAPITQGASVRGFIIGRFLLPTNVVKQNLSSLRLKFQDIKGFEYQSAPKALGRQRPDFEVVPGLGKIVP
jgi:hypothetical protein